jgi:hypothetical protein
MNRRLAQLLHPASRSDVADPDPATARVTTTATTPVAPPPPPAPVPTRACAATVLVVGRGAAGWARRLEADLGPAWNVITSPETCPDTRPGIASGDRWDILPEAIIVRGADFALVSHLRSRFRALPILVLDPGAAPATVVALYEAGVDQVVTTQAAAVLSSHVRAVIRRRRSHAGASWATAGSAA